MLINIKKLGLAEKYFILFFIFSIIVQIYYFQRVQVHYPSNGFTSENYYEIVAENIALHNTVATGEFPNLELDRKRPPLFSYMLGYCYKLFGVDLSIALILNNILLTLSIIVIFFTGRLIHPFIGLFSAIIIFIDPQLIARANGAEAEISFMFFFSISLYFLIKFLTGNNSKIIIFFFSFFFMLSIFARVVTLYYVFFVPFIVFFVFHIYLKENFKKYLPFIIIFLCVNLVPVGIWMYRNYAISGNADLAAMKHIHLLNFMAAQAMSDSEGLQSRGVAKQLIEKKYFDNSYYQNLKSGEKEKYRTKIALELMIKYWPDVLKHYFYCSYPALFFGTPVQFYSLGLSKIDYINQQKIMHQLIIGGNAQGGGIKKYVFIVKGLFKTGYLFAFFHGAFIKIYLTVLLLFTFCGFYIMTFKSNEIEKKRVALFLFSLFGYIVLITCTWASSRLRTQILPIMSFMSSYYLYYLGANYGKKPLNLFFRK